MFNNRHYTRPNLRTFCTQLLSNKNQMAPQDFDSKRPDALSQKEISGKGKVIPDVTLEPSKVLFVSNLPFSTSDDALKELSRPSEMLQTLSWFLTTTK